MDADLQVIYDKVMQAKRPEDVFAEMTVVLPPRLLAEHLKPEMEELRAALDKDSYSHPEDVDAVTEARARLEEHYLHALERASCGLYALDDYMPYIPPGVGKSIEVGGTRYVVGAKCHVGQHADLYLGRMAIDEGSAGVVIRLAHTPEDNPYLFNEIRMLQLLHREDVGYWRNVPFMLGRFHAGERVGLVSRYFAGVTLTRIRSDPLHRDGLDQRHVVWVMDRLLGMMWYYHALGIIHGRIEPDKVLVRPSNHNVMLSGWGSAVYKPAITNESIESTGGAFEPPEIQEGGGIGPWTDIYCLGKTIIWLIGGDPVTNEIPDVVEPKIRRFLQNMVRTSPRARPHDAQQLYVAQNRLKDSLWKRRFLHLQLTERNDHGW